MNNKVLIADSVRYSPHLYGFDVLMQQEVRRLDVSKLLMCFLDTVDSQVLPFLAEEFDVLGVKGWDFADTDDKKRALLKQAIELHRYKGTPWAIKQVIVQAGYTNATLVERSGGKWWQFRVNVNIADNAIDVTQVNLATALITEYKRASAILEGIFFQGLDFTDAISITETGFSATGENEYGDAINTSKQFLYDGTFAYDGTRNYSQDLDVITIKKIP